MPIADIAVLVFIVLAFAIFSGTLAWASLADRDSSTATGEYDAHHSGARLRPTTA